MGDIADMRGAVYKITCTANGRTYIGSTVDFPSRRRRHIHLLRRGMHHSLHLQRSYDKHGEQAITFEIIDDGVPVATLLDRESCLIRSLKPAFNSSSVNATRLGAKQSSECKAKVSRANKGRSHSPESKTKISSSMVGNTNAKGNTSRRMVTPEIKGMILSLAAGGMGSYRIGKLVGLSKKTVINVRSRRHSYD